MPDRSDSPSLPPGPLQIDGEVFNELLRRVIDAATSSAEGATKSAAAIQSLEAQIQEMRGQVTECSIEMKKIREVAEKEEKGREERGKWLRSLIKPETLYYTVVIIGTMLGASWAPKLLPLLGGSP